MKRLASRSTWWHTLPQKCNTRSTPQRGEFLRPGHVPAVHAEDRNSITAASKPTTSSSAGSGTTRRVETSRAWMISKARGGSQRLAADRWELPTLHAMGVSPFNCMIYLFGKIGRSIGTSSPWICIA